LNYFLFAEAFYGLSAAAAELAHDKEQAFESLKNRLNVAPHALIREGEFITLFNQWFESQIIKALTAVIA
jgi:ABC-type amino acid transport substrate-binding protein